MICRKAGPKITAMVRWRDIQVGGAVRPSGATDDAAVEFVVPFSQK